MSQQSKAEPNVCPDCQAGPDPANARLVVGSPIETWHTPACPQWTMMQVNLEAEARRVKEQDAWPQGIFPAVHERLRQAAAAIEPGTPAQPFIDALNELVQAQADTTGCVVLHRWEEILERHFPPPLPDPDHATE